MAMIGHGQPINQATGFTTNAPTTFRTIVFACDSSSYALSGVAASLSHGHPLVAASASYAWTIADLVTRDIGLSLDPHSFIVDPQQAGLTQAHVIQASKGTYSLDGLSANLRIPNWLVADLGVYALTPKTSNIRRDARITAAKSLPPFSYQITGIAASFPQKVLTADPASYALSGSPGQSDHGLGIGSKNYVLTGINAVLTKAGALISATSGSYAWSIANLVTRDTGLTCVGGSFALSGQPAILLFQSFNLACSPGSYSISGLGSQRDLAIGAATGAYTISPTTTNLVRSGNFALSCAGGSYALSGVSDIMVRGRKLIAVLGTYAETGLTMVPRLNHRIAPALNAFAVSGVAARVVRFGRVSIGVGSYVETGISMTPKAARKVAPVVGVYALAGVAANFIRARTVIAASGSYTETGVAASFRTGRKLAIATGSYLLTGSPVAFQTQNSTAISPSTGAFTIGGATAVLRADHIMVAAPGSYALNGVTAAQQVAHAIRLLTATYSLNAIATAARASHAFGPLAGVYTIGGTSISQTGAHAIIADFHTFGIHGTGVNLPKTRVPMVISAGAYAVAGRSVIFAYGPGIAADHGIYTAAGDPITFVHVVPPNMGATVSPDTGLDIVGTITDPEIIGRPSDQLVA